MKRFEKTGNMSIHSILRKVYRKIIHSKHYDHRVTSDSIAEKIRRGGGTVGANFDIYNTRLDMTAPYLINIGDNVTITNSSILTHDASLKNIPVLRDLAA